jgi:TPR repeat protein
MPTKILGIALALSLSAATAAWADAQADFDRGSAAYHAGKLTEAVDWFHKAADQGNTRAQNSLGFMYQEGLGIPKDFKQAMFWYRKAANRGDAAAQLNLGVMYERGEGVAPDNGEARRWYSLAAAHNANAAENQDLRAIEEARKRLMMMKHEGPTTRP